MACIVPGVIMYIVVNSKLYRIKTLVVTANPVSGGSQAIVQHPNYAATLASQFIEFLPLRQAVDQPALTEAAGATQGVAQFCINCGVQIEAGGQSCESCGAKQ